MVSANERKWSRLKGSKVIIILARNTTCVHIYVVPLLALECLIEDDTRADDDGE